jgi:hypothetical protein
MAFHYCTLKNGTKILEDGSVVDRGLRRKRPSSFPFFSLPSGRPLMCAWCDVFSVVIGVAKGGSLTGISMLMIY